MPPTFIHPWELQWIGWLQSFPFWFLETMRWVSKLGHAPCLVLLVVLVAARAGAKHGLVVIQFLSVSGLYMTLFKDMMHHPRPFWLSLEIQALGPAGSFGMPSGHAMMAWVWVLAAKNCQHRALHGLAQIMVLAVGGSRVVLGVHSPCQVIVGWALGYAILKAIMAGTSPKQQVGQHAGLTGALIYQSLWLLPGLILGWMLYPMAESLDAPQAWPGLADHSLQGTWYPSTLSPQPHRLYALIFALASGWGWVAHRFPLKPSMKVDAWRQGLGLAIGLTFILVSYLTCRPYLPPIREAEGVDFLLWAGVVNLAMAWLVLVQPWLMGARWYQHHHEAHP